MKNKFIVLSLAALITIGVWAPGASYAQTTGSNFGITPGMSETQIITILTQVLQQLMAEVQAISAQRAAQAGSTVFTPTMPAIGTSTTGTVTVTSPSNGTVFASTTAPIPFTWTWRGPASAMGTPYDYLLDQSGNVVYTQIGYWSASGGGSDVLPPPMRLVIPDGTNQYRLVVCPFDSGPTGNMCGASGFFSITKTAYSPSVAPIDVTAPSGGESLATGQSYTIRWSDSGLPSNAVISVVLFNGTNSSIANPSYTIVSGLPATATSYVWTVAPNSGNWGVGLGDSIWNKLAGLMVNRALAGSNQYVIGIQATVPPTGPAYVGEGNNLVASGSSNVFTIH